MKQGYTKKVLEVQIAKYENALKMDDQDFDDWLRDYFGSTADCPVCLYRFHRGLECGHDLPFEPCLAIIDNVACANQEWFRELRNIQSHFIIDSDRARKLLSTRLKYWQRIYKEKYPEVK